MKDKVILTKSTFSAVLDMFSACVDDDVYVKIPYRDWRQLVKFSKSTDKNDIDRVRIYYDVDKGFWVQVPGEESKTFAPDDDSFGQFLLNEIFLTEEDNEDMEKYGNRSNSDVNVGNSPGSLVYSNYTFDECLHNWATTTTGTTSIVDNAFATITSTSATLQELTKAFEEFGVSLYDATGNLRDIASIIQDIADIYITRIANDSFMNKTNKKEEKKMKGFNFDFGPCTGNDIRMSMYGLAVKNAAGVWVSYNAADGTIVDVDVFNFEGGKYMFKMPVAVKDIAVGDIVVHNRVPMFIVSIDGGRLEAVDVRAGEQKSIIPTTNMFGFNFVTKIVSAFSAFTNAPTPDAPFGNMLPFMMMGEGGEDIDPMLMFMMMQQGGGADMFSNPMMMYFMMKDGGSDNLLPLMMMMNMQK